MIRDFNDAEYDFSIAFVEPCWTLLPNVKLCRLLGNCLTPSPISQEHLHNVEDVEEVDVKKRTMFMRILWQAVAWRMDWKTIPFIIKYYEHYAIYFSICYVFYWEFPTELCDIFCGFASQKLGLTVWMMLHAVMNVLDTVREIWDEMLCKML